MPANIQPIPYELIPNPAVIWAILGSLGSAAVTGIVFLARVIYRNRKAARRMLGAALADDTKQEDNADQGKIVTEALLQYLKNQEARDIADRAERARQWERIETLTLMAKDQASALQSVLMAVQNSAIFQDQAHGWHAKQLEGIAENQVHLSRWLQDNLHRSRGTGT